MIGEIADLVQLLSAWTRVQFATDTSMNFAGFRAVPAFSFFLWSGDRESAPCAQNAFRLAARLLSLR